MRKLLLKQICCTTFYLIAHQVNAQYANIELSNLSSATAINLSLTPYNTEFVSLGSASRQWKYAYLTGSVYFDNLPTMRMVLQSTYLGADAGKSVTETIFNNNTGLGDHSLKSTTTGQYNSGAGYAVMMLTTTGQLNAAAGYMSMRNNTTGSNNSALGFHSLYSNKAGTGNIAIGYRTLYNLGVTAPASPGLPQGNYNIAIGSQAMYTNRTGYHNVAIGAQALYGGTSGTGNTAAGHQTMYSNTNGTENTAIGYRALYYQTTSINNVAVGDSALYANRVGANNTAIGSGALAKTTQASNTAVGYEALKNLGSGTFNVGVGHLSGKGLSTGGSNVFIGSGSGSSRPTINEAAAIGYNTLATASNQIRIGNADIVEIGGTKAWSKISDARLMKIEDLAEVAGLKFIEELHPVTYASIRRKPLTDGRSRTAAENRSGYVANTSSAVFDTIITAGFLPAELSQRIRTEPSMQALIDEPAPGSDEYGIRYAEFVVPLVKSVQEISGELEEKKDVLNDVYHDINEIRKMLTELARLSKNNSPVLMYNTPNPLAGTTTIFYSLPSTGKKAFIVIYDKLGRKLKEVDISGRTNGTIQMDMSNYASGIYHYSLVIDGKVAKSEKMLKAQ